MRTAILTLSACLLLPACLSVKTFSDATQDVNEGFALGKQLRDRCNETKNVDHCQAWIEYKRAEEADSDGLLDYDKALARWEAKGPY